MPSANNMQWSHSILNPGLYISEGGAIWSLTRGEKKLLGEIPVSEWPWFVDRSEKIWWYNNTTFELTSNDTPAYYFIFTSINLYSGKCCPLSTKVQYKQL
jgi:hypothetical protein